MTVSYLPKVDDVRAPDASSLTVLPRLGEDEFPRLYSFMKSNWPEFDVLGTHGEDRAKPGERWWSIGAVEVKEGPPLFQVQFRKEDLTFDYANILSFLRWTTAGALDPRLDPRYYNNGIVAFSEGSGDQGWPYGGGSGPYAMWVHSDPLTQEDGTPWPDRRVGSDAIVGLHWFDHHVSLNAIFVPRRKGGTPPPTGNYTLWNVDPDGNVLGKLTFTNGLPSIPNDYGAVVLVDDNEQPVGHLNWEALE